MNFWNYNLNDILSKWFQINGIYFRIFEIQATNYYYVAILQKQIFPKVNLSSSNGSL